MGLLQGLQQGRFQGLQRGFTDNKFASASGAIVLLPGAANANAAGVDPLFALNLILLPAAADASASGVTPSLAVSGGSPQNLAPALADASAAGVTPAMNVRSNITASLLTSGSSTTNSTTFTTASVTPTANRLVIAAVLTARTTLTSVPSLTGNGLTWVAIADQSYTANQRRVSLFRAMGSSPSSGAITIDCNVDITNTESAVWAIVEFAGVDTSGTNGSGAVVQSAVNTSGTNVTTQTTTLSAFEHATNHNFTATGLNTNASITPGSGFTELSDAGQTALTITLETAHKVNDTTCDPTWTTAQDGMVSIEIKSALLP